LSPKHGRRTHKPERPCHHRTLVEGHALRSHHLVGLVPLPRQHDGVSRLRELERPPDREPPIRQPFEGSPGQTDREVVQDALRILRAGVVRGEDHQVRVTLHGFSHGPALSAIPVPARPEQDDRAEVYILDAYIDAYIGPHDPAN